MKDFNSYIKNKSDTKKEETDLKKEAEKAAKELPEGTVKMAEDMYKKYQGKNENELVADILKTAAQNRKDGTLSDEAIDNFSQSISHMLNKEQRKKLDDIIKQLKS